MGKNKFGEKIPKYISLGYQQKKADPGVEL